MDGIRGRAARRCGPRNEFEFVPEKLPGARCEVVRRAGVRGQESAAVPQEQPQLCGGVFAERPSEKRTRPSPKKRNGNIRKMTYTGTLIEDLMATVERAEQRAQTDGALFSGAVVSEPLLVEPMLVDSWFASVEQSIEYDSKLLGVA